MLMIQNNPIQPLHNFRMNRYYGGTGLSFKIGTIPVSDEVPVHDDRGTNACYVFRSSIGVVSIQSRSTEGCCHQRHGDTQYSSQEEYERMNALGVTQYGQMTAGSYMYIGPQGIVHGTSITLLNAARQHPQLDEAASLAGVTFITSGLGGMSGAQAKAATIAGASHYCRDKQTRCS